MGATISVFTAQQISIRSREVTWENISCVSKGQGEKLQLAVYNSSTLLSYWFCPRFWLGSGHIAAFGGTLWLSAGTLGEKTPPQNKWLECVVGQSRQNPHGRVWVLAIVLFVCGHCPRDATAHHMSVKCKEKQTRTPKWKGPDVRI